MNINSFRSGVAYRRQGDHWLTTLRLRQNGRHFADDIFKRISLNENVRILIEISPKFVPKIQINNIPTVVQIMAWHRQGDKPLSEPMVVRLPTHICVTRPRWVTREPVSHETIIWTNNGLVCRRLYAATQQTMTEWSTFFDGNFVILTIFLLSAFPWIPVIINQHSFR